MTVTGRAGVRLAAFFLCMSAGGAGAQMRPPPLLPAAAPAQPGAQPLYPSSKGADREQWAAATGEYMVHNVTRPTLQPFLPAANKATGAAVIIAPGGAFMALSMTNEGWAVAQWLADRGVAAFVLKYRLDPTPADVNAFAAAITAKIAGHSNGAGDANLPNVDPAATQDGIAALQLVRQHAAAWGIDPHRVGFIGFSAGAELSRRMALLPDAGQRPDFSGIIYGPMNAVAVPGDAPPLFAALAADDPIFGSTGFGLVEAWKSRSRPVEVHYYEHGGHGFGARQQGTTSDLWLDQFYAWLHSRGTLRPGPAG